VEVVGWGWGGWWCRFGGLMGRGGGGRVLLIGVLAGGVVRLERRFVPGVV
jgi:hypothetical protein